eukprot:487201_1
MNENVNAQGWDSDVEDQYIELEDTNDELEDKKDDSMQEFDSDTMKKCRFCGFFELKSELIKIYKSGTYPPQFISVQKSWYRKCVVSDSTKKKDRCWDCNPCREFIFSFRTECNLCNNNNQKIRRKTKPEKKGTCSTSGCNSQKKWVKMKGTIDGKITVMYNKGLSCQKCFRVKYKLKCLVSCGCKFREDYFDDTFMNKHYPNDWIREKYVYCIIDGQRRWYRIDFWRVDTNELEFDLASEYDENEHKRGKHYTSDKYKKKK